MRQGTGATFKVFVRNFWRMEGGRRVPNSGARGTTIAKRCTEDEARTIAQEYNRTHNPGTLSRKAEFTEE